MVVAWSTFGPHPIGCERFATVSNGFQRHVVRAGHRCHPGETSLGQNPDKDEAAGSSPARPTTPGFTRGTTGPLSSPIAAARLHRLRTAVGERITSRADV